MGKQEIVAMLLAGGQGSRLGVLTEYVAKPAVPFGSRYRIIDFPLSNCTNSGIETVGVLTQYQPLELNSYMGNGHPWDLDRNQGGLFILPPYQSSSRSDWYKGTANSIYQNINFVDSFQPEYVLILSGDHIYKMNYEKMLRHHKERNADATIAVIEVPWDEASRFGIMNTAPDGTIVDFEEKPKNPKNNLASMGIYIFTWEKLRRILIEDEKNPKSSNDFGKNVIPAMLAEKMNMVSYTFQGYWKDVGTIDSLWQANMDLLDQPEAIDLHDSSWRIYTKNPIRPSHYIGKNAVVENSALTDGVQIQGKVYHSVISDSVVVEEGAEVRDSILMPGVRVGAGTILNRCVVGMGTKIGANSKIGVEGEGDKSFVSKLCSNGITVFQGELEIRDNVVIAGNSMIPAPTSGTESSVVKGLLRKYS